MNNSLSQNNLNGASGGYGAQYYWDGITTSCSAGRIERCKKHFNDERIRIAKIQKQEATSRELKERASDEKDWALSDDSLCRQQQDVHACDGVLFYLKRRPHGAFAAKATALLEASAPRLALLQDEEDWKTAMVQECAKPTESDCDDGPCPQHEDPRACDGVRKYLKSRPDGVYAAKATALLEASAARFATLQDDEDWKASRVEQCANPTASSDCDATERYVEIHETGKHADEARALLAKVGPRLLVLEQNEEEVRMAEEPIHELCTILVQQAEVEAEIQRQARVDRESGTVNLYQRRKLTEARLFLQDRRELLLKEVRRLQVPFARAKHCPISQR